MIANRVHRDPGALRIGFQILSGGDRGDQLCSPSRQPEQAADGLGDGPWLQERIVDDEDDAARSRLSFVGRLVDEERRDHDAVGWPARGPRNSRDSAGAA